jgi:hypothetical protein
VINELLVLTVMLVAGCAVMRTTGVTGWGLPGLGLLAGILLWIAVGFLQVAAWVPAWPWITMVLTLGLSVGWWVWRWRQGADVGVRLVPALASLAGLWAAVAAFRGLNMVKWHTDSFVYLMVGRLLADGDYRSVNTIELVSTRVLGVPLLHAPANMAGEFYLRSITPLLAIATIATTAWFLRQGTRMGAGRLPAAVVTSLLVLLLLTNNRVIQNSFYINGHMLMGAVVMIIAASGWLLAASDRSPRQALMVLQILAIPALVIIRPEGPLMGILILLPTWLAPQISRTYRSITMAVFGGATVLLALVQGWFFVDRDVAMPSSVTGPLALGFATLLAIPLLRWKWLNRRTVLLLWVAEAGLWLATLAIAQANRGSGTLKSSIHATYVNLFHGAGAWGLSIVILSVLLVLGYLCFRQAPHQILLRFPLTTFVPFVFLMAYLREGGYRIGLADSLNRMIMHEVPLAVLLLLVVLTVGDREEPTEAPAKVTPAEPRREPAEEGLYALDDHPVRATV